MSDLVDYAGPIVAGLIGLLGMLVIVLLARSTKDRDDGAAE